MSFLVKKSLSHRGLTRIPVRQVCERREKRIFFSGIQPTGVLHLGNYFGAVRGWLELQDVDNADLLISVVDLHAITTDLKSREELSNSILDMTASLLACGIQPGKCTLFQQSRVPQHTQLSWIFSCFSTLAQLNRLGQYKEKAVSFPRGDIPVALLTYPLLQAADILLYRATDVPVGEDQAQHMDVACRIARNFNKRYGREYFPVPRRDEESEKPGKKMSKSDPDGKSRIEISDSPEQMRNKVKKALTDFTGAVSYDPKGRPGVANLIELHSAISGQSPADICQSAVGLDTGQFKLILADIVIQKFGPLSDSYCRLRKDKDFLVQVLKEGSLKAEAVADRNLKEIKEIMGLL